MFERAPRGRRGTPASGAIEKALEEELGGGAARVWTLEDDEEEEEEEAEPARPYAESPAGTTRRCLCDLVLRLPTRPRGDLPSDTA